MYNKIKNPVSGRFININSKLGKNIIKRYLSIIKGGSSTEEVLLDTVDELIKEYLCPITHQLMIDPVIIDSGNTFEREAILRYFQNHNRDPVTNEILSNREVIPNKHLKGAINRFVDNYDKKYGRQEGEKWNEIKELVSDFKTTINERTRQQRRQQETVPASQGQSSQPAIQPASQPVATPTSQGAIIRERRTEPMSDEEYNRDDRTIEEIARYLENKTSNAQVIQDGVRHFSTQTRLSYRDAMMYLRYVL